MGVRGKKRQKYENTKLTDSVQELDVWRGAERGEEVCEGELREDVELGGILQLWLDFVVCCASPPPSHVLICHGSRSRICALVLVGISLSIHSIFSAV